MELGAEGLVHGQAGKRSNHALPDKFRQRILGLYRKFYSGEPGERFGPTLAVEHLLEDHGLEVDAETLRRWLLDEGLWTRERKRKPYRQRRTRRAHFGELVQMDGSFHEWLENRGPEGCLIHMVDDATSTSLATMTDQETTWGVADTLRAWIEKYGIPRALYGRKNLKAHCGLEDGVFGSTNGAAKTGKHYPDIAVRKHVREVRYRIDRSEFGPGQRPSRAMRFQLLRQCSWNPSRSPHQEDPGARI